MEETVVRSTSFYLLEQHLNEIKGNKYSYNLDGLKERYAEIELVNKGIARRIQTISKGDAGKNAIICLNTFAQMISHQIDSEFSSIESIFSQDT